MPLNPSATVGTNIREFRTGKTYAHTAAKFGKKDADRQAIAVALSTKAKAHNRDIGGLVPPNQMMAQPGLAPQPLMQSSPMVQGLSPTVATPNLTAPAAPPTAMPQAPAPGNMQPQASGTPQNGAPPAIPQNGVPPTPPQVPTMASMAAPGVPGLAAGGSFDMTKGPNMSPSWEERSEARQLHVGPVLSAVPGRTDHHPIKVPSSSYVLPAATVSSMGHGNSMAGLAAAHAMFGSGPYGFPSIGTVHGRGAPRPPHFNSGGSTPGESSGHPVDVNVSGGEYIIPPWEIIRRWGSLKAGHKILDKFVMSNRKDEIKTLRALPPPAKS